MSNYICTICDHVDVGSSLPQKCPYCGAPSTNLKMLTEEEVKNLAKNPRTQSMVGTMADSVVLRGYNPKGVNKQNMFA